MNDRFGPKTWGAWSARLAAPYAALMAFAAAQQTALGPKLALLALAPLGIGAVRTLKRQSGGLRLLSGAWGVMAGLALAPILAGSLAPLNWVLAGVAVAGLLLTVLHKEK